MYISVYKLNIFLFTFLLTSKDVLEMGSLSAPSNSVKVLINFK